MIWTCEKLIRFINFIILGWALKCNLEGPTITKTKQTCVLTQNVCISLRVTLKSGGKTIKTSSLGCETVSGDCKTSVCKSVRTLLPAGTTLDECEVILFTLRRCHIFKKSETHTFKR